MYYSKGLILNLIMDDIKLVGDFEIFVILGIIFGDLFYRVSFAFGCKPRL